MGRLYNTKGFVDAVLIFTWAFRGEWTYYSHFMNKETGVIEGDDLLKAMCRLRIRTVINAFFKQSSTDELKS